MENVFKFMVVRPPEALEHPITITVSGPQTAFLPGLAKLKRANASRQTILAAVEKFAATGGFCAKIDTLKTGRALAAFYSEVAEQGVSALGSLDTLSKRLFGKTVAETVALAQFGKEVQILEDSVVAIKILSRDEGGNLKRMVDALRAAALMMAYRDGSLKEEAFDSYVTAGIVLPESIFPLTPSLSNPRSEDPKKREAAQREAKALYDRFKSVDEALKELGTVKSGDLEASVLKASAGVASAVVTAGSVLSDATVHTLHTTGTLTAGANLNAIKIAQPGVPKFDPKESDGFGFRLSAAGEKKITPKTRTLLKGSGLVLTHDSLEEVHARLEREKSELAGRLNAIGRAAAGYKTKNIGGIHVKIPTYEFDVSVHFPGVFIPINPDFGKIPISHGSIKPAGITDLLIVKQNLKRYEGGDVAHIENVLKGELKRREHTVTHTTENYYMSEAETTVSKESSVSTTERFEMSQAASEVIKNEQSLKAGLSVKAKYGPAVEVNASVEGSVSHSKQKSVEHAENFSRSVTQSSVEKITQRVLEKQSIKITDSTEEKNIHALDNTGGSGHISGIYQWVNKVYEAQIFNYGLRTMFDFMVPEPAAYVIETLKQEYAGGVDIVKPVEFPLSPDDIQPYNYNYWVREYGATGINPPPQMYLTKSEQISQANIEKNKEFVHTAEITIDEGYEAIYGFATCSVVKWDEWGVDINIGQRMKRFEDGAGWTWGSNLDYETGEIPFSVRTFKTESFTSTIEVKCRRTERAMDLWRQETYGLILQAYQNRCSEYEEKLALAKAQAGVEISGKNPGLNKIIIEDELKKHAITLLSDQHFDMFGAIENGTDSMPQVNVAEAASEGKYVRFFEQAFEWENMTYLFYPYFWGRKSQWVEKLNYEDVDPLFADFVKAGFSRVSVPIREGFEGAVDHFMQTGEVWNGGELPDVSSELYVSIAKELSEQLGRPGNEVPEGEPWEVRVPTTLVKLRQDQELPKWKKDDDGNWIEENG